MRTFLLSLIITFAAPLWAQQPNVVQSPVLEGKVLYIRGRIDNHIYEFLTREARKLTQVRVVDLSSAGGNMEWALLIANKLSAMKVNTRLSSNSICASACVFVFGAGQQRIAAPGTWLGIHGARLSAGLAVRFGNLCFQDGKFSPELKACSKAMADWQKMAMSMTQTAFELMERHGVSPDLFNTYMSMEDDSDWTEEFNVLKKPDWVLRSEDALAYELVTRLEPAAAPIRAASTEIGN